jgi:uncharacterized damage-inducible protein DinB
MTYYSSTDLANAFRTVRKNTLQVARDVPADQYGFRATPDTRSIGETLAHIASNSRWIQKLHGVDKKTHVGIDDFQAYIGEAHAYAATLATPDAILAALEENGRQFGDWLGSLAEPTLAETVSFPPPLQPSQKTRFEMLLGAKEHEMHHRAQLMVLERLLGIVPHLTRARMARA